MKTEIFANSFTNFEEIVIENKWFILALMALVILSLAIVKSNGDEYAENMSECYKATQAVLDGPQNDEKFSVNKEVSGSVDYAKAVFYSCLLSNGVDIRSVAPFDVLFPLSVVDVSYGDGVFEVQESYSDLNLESENGFETLD